MSRSCEIDSLNHRFESSWLWNLTGTSAALLPMCLSNFRVSGQFLIQISRLRNFMRSYDKTSYRILKRGLLPFYWRVRHLTATTFYGHLELIATTSHEHNLQLGCLFNSMFRLIAEITSKLRVMVLRERNLSVPSITGGSPWWRSSQWYRNLVYVMVILGNTG